MTKAVIHSEPRGLRLIDQAAEIEGFAPTAALKVLKEKAAQSYKATGLPTRHWENWHYTDLRLVEKENFIAPAAARPVKAEADEIVLINGNLESGFSRGGLKATPLAQAVKENATLVESLLRELPDFAQNPLVALNAAGMGRGIVLQASGDAGAMKLHFTTQGDVAANILALVVLEDGAKLELSETFSAEDQSLSNYVNIYRLGKDAKLIHHRLQQEGQKAAHIAHSVVRIGEAGRYESYALTTGAALSRNEIYAQFQGEDAACVLEGIYLVQNKQLCDTTIEISHTRPRCVSRQNFRGVIDDQARAVFQGKIHVSCDAQKTDGYQLNHALLLSETAEIDCKPELEIYADDVKCSHGATAGQPDDAALFYLRSRGIPENSARALLVEGFLNEILETIENESVRALWAERIGTWLRGRF